MIFFLSMVNYVRSEEVFMATTLDLAELIFGDIHETPEDLEKNIP